MRKYLKRKNKAVAFIAIALMICTLCALPISASTENWVEIDKDEEGYYLPLQNYNGYKVKVVYRYKDHKVDTGDKTFALRLKDLETNKTDSSILNSGGENCVFEGQVDEVANDLFNQSPSFIRSSDRALTCAFKAESDYSKDYFKIYYYSPPPSASPSTLVGEMFSSFRAVIDGLTNGIKGMFNCLLWVDGTATSGLSHFAKFGFVMAGLSLALGLGYVIINKIRG